MKRNVNLDEDVEGEDAIGKLFIVSTSTVILLFFVGLFILNTPYSYLLGPIFLIGFLFAVLAIVSFSILLEGVGLGD